jgi:RNA-directed DNA polymerase
MKRQGNIWPKICSLDALHAAHLAARQGKAHYKEVKWVNANLDAALNAVHRSLVTKTFTTSPYEVSERFDGRKLRTIHKLPYYPDRIVQHALVNACEPAWQASFIRDTFQSIKGRGTHDARKRVLAAVKGNDGLFALKFDIRKYYPSVNPERMKFKVRKTIKCADTLWLIDNIVDSCDGLPIGNYTSQFLGNVYLSDFDWWVKQTLKPMHYFRYCDDIVVIAGDAESCHRFRNLMFERLNTEYGLEVKPDWQVFPVDSRGLDFVGFVFTSTSVKLRSGIASGVRNKAQQIRSSATTLTPHQIANGAGSYWGWCKHGRGRGLWNKHMTKDVQAAIYAAKCQLREAQTCK